MIDLFHLFSLRRSLNEHSHSQSQHFWILVEDVDGETILHYEYFILYRKVKNETHSLLFTIPMPPQYFLRADSDKWLGVSTCLPISF